MRGNYDVVIVGAGTAGRLLATRLAGEPGLRVLLLARSHDAGDTLPFFARGHRTSYSGWPSGWGFFDLLPYFKRSEDAPGRDLVTRGRGGPVSVSPPSESTAGPVPPFAPAHAPPSWPPFAVPFPPAASPSFSSAVPHRSANPNLPPSARPSPASSAPHSSPPSAQPSSENPPSPLSFAPFAPLSIPVFFPRASDLGGGLEEGAGMVDHAVLAGFSDGPEKAAGVVDHAALAGPGGEMAEGGGMAGSVTSVIADVDRLVISGGRVIGVSYRSAEGRLETASAGEVVLAAGAVGSARLLLASGVGPADDLRAYGIDVAVDLPGVGANLQDRPVATMLFESARPLAVSSPFFALLRSRDDLPGPDLRLVWSVTPDGHGWTVEITPAQPWSRGIVRLDAVDPGFYADDRDLDTVVAGLRLARTAFDSLGSESVPGPAIDDETQLRAYALRTVRPAGDAAGTLALGPVVDDDLRPHGVEGLRVADASVMPSLPSADIAATVCAIAERAAELVCGRRHTE
ncbi:GMC family oxidoreductase [Actinoplanes solisilvae]|uniref:GMC family oxidoreductase n=1 Tax=Actinoplanes solisilvae TaxID=2486853 RepID=UPI000FDC4CB7|nr:GMC oxidoreductase [Actinoplanes solisilvae]